MSNREVFHPHHAGHRVPPVILAIVWRHPTIRVAHRITKADAVQRRARNHFLKLAIGLDFVSTPCGSVAHHGKADTRRSFVRCYSLHVLFHCIRAFGFVMLVLFTFVAALATLHVTRLAVLATCCFARLAALAARRVAQAAPATLLFRIYFVRFHPLLKRQRLATQIVCFAAPSPSCGFGTMGQAPPLSARKEHGRLSLAKARKGTHGDRC